MPIVTTAIAVVLLSYVGKTVILSGGLKHELCYLLAPMDTMVGKTVILSGGLNTHLLLAAERWRPSAVAGAKVLSRESQLENGAP